MLEGKEFQILVPLYEMHDNQMKDCDAEVKVSDWQMNAWTWQACDTVEGQRGVADDPCVKRFIPNTASGHSVT